MNEELTPWLPATVKPVRHGFYDVKEGGIELGWRRWWDGCQWMNQWPDGRFIPSAVNSSPIPIYWRGLAKEPK